MNLRKKLGILVFKVTFPEEVLLLPCAKLAKKTSGQHQLYHYTNFEHVMVLLLLLCKRFFRIR